MTLKKINEDSRFQLEKVSNKQYKATTEVNELIFKFNGTIKSLYTVLKDGNFELETLKQYEEYTEISNTDLSDLVAKEGKVETFTTGVEETKKVFIPEIGTSFEDYYFPVWRNSFARRINIGKNIYISGPAGSGKSEMIMKLAKMSDQKFVRINMHSGMATADLIGRMLVQANPENGTAETVFKYGYIPTAMLKGWWVILDEIDSAEATTLFRLQPILEGNPLVVNENEGEVITPHENFRIFTTGNTKGRGDEENSYIGTNFMNASFLDRFSLFEMEYTSKEIDIVNNILQDKELSEKIVQVFKLFRDAIDQGQLANSVFSTRRLKTVAEVLKSGDTLKEAFEYEVIGRYTKDEQKLLMELLKDVFDSSHYLTKKWTLGMDHPVPTVPTAPIVPKVPDGNGVYSSGTTAPPVLS